MTGSEGNSGAHGGAGDGSGHRNTVTGGTVGQLVQSGHIGTVHLHSPAQRWTPHQIRPPHRVFVNRYEELAALTGALHALGDGSGPVVIVLTGLGGVGKTELVAYWARREAARFPGGELYADLGAVRHDGGVDTGEILGSFLRSLGVEDVPDSAADRANLFRSVTAGLRILVFLDNVEHAAEVRALTPSDGLVVVASRRRLDGLALDGARVHTVAPLTTGAGSELVRQWLGARRGSDQDLAELVRLCGGLPLALNAVGGQLISRLGTPVHRVVAALADKQRAPKPAGSEEDTVDQAFDEVYDALSEPGRRLYRLIGVHPGPQFTVALLRAAGCERIDEPLGELLDAHLVDVTADGSGGAAREPGAQDGEDSENGEEREEPAEARFTCHDLVRLHARRRARAEVPAAEYETALLRIVDYYRAKAAEADRVVLGDRFRLPRPPAGPAGPVHPNGPADPADPADPAAADSPPDLDWLDRESANLMAVLRAAAERGWHGAVWQLCESLWPLYHGRKLYADWIDAHALGVEAARWDGRPDAEIRMRNQLARAHYELADYPHATEQLDLAAELLPLVDDPRLRGMLWESQGLVCLKCGQPETAADLFTKAREANHGDSHGVVVQSYNLAQALLAARLPQRALAVAEEAAGQAERTGDRAMAMRLGILLGRLHDGLGDTATAVTRLTRAAGQAADLGLRAKEEEALELLVGLAARTGDTAAEQAGRERLGRLQHAAVPPPERGGS
ncbi:hypothetical protein GCM10009760_34060 [Kitasatospora kazusensis]|uniref:Uncharacterized protein n=1 Tax=Kitasatospora kazusensis TaxID=407974 RepID=A0ABN2ZPK6_9ACTN